MKLLQKIQSWPPEKKKKAVIWATALVMVVIIIVWLSFFNIVSVKSESTSSFLGNLKQSFNELIKSAKK